MEPFSKTRFSKVSAEPLLGERRIIDLIVRRLDKIPRMRMPFGDDVSAMKIGEAN